MRSLEHKKSHTPKFFSEVFIIDDRYMAFFVLNNEVN